MATEQEINKDSKSHKEFQSLLEQDFKDRKLKENQIIKAKTTIELPQGRADTPLSQFSMS